MEFRPAFLIPVYNHEAVLDHLLTMLASYDIPCLMVNDGSNDACRGEMERLAETHNNWVSLQHLEINQGKGAAVMAGIGSLLEQGFTHAFQIDADCQHDLSQIDRFLAVARDNPEDLILGAAEYDESVPKSRLYGRYVTHVWVWIETLSLSIPDSMCGFRIYPLAKTHDVITRFDIGKRMEFDVEVVVRMYWAGVRVRSFPVKVNYPMDGISHFNVLDDNVRISKTHTKLFFGMLWRIPLLLWRRFVWVR